MIIKDSGKESHLVITGAQLGGGNFARLSALPAFKKWVGRELIFRSVGANLRYVLDNWPEAEWEAGIAAKVRDTFLSVEADAAGVSFAKRSGELLQDPGDYYTYKREPMAHQRTGFLLSRDKAAFALLMEQGTGKTKIVIDNACYLWQRGEIDFLVIVAWPNGVHRNWVEYEFPQDMTVDYVAEYWSDNHATKARRLAYRKLMLQRDKLRVMTFNIEAFTSEHGREFIMEILQENRVMLVVDQSASIKNPHAERTKFLIKECSRLAPFRRILDGSPVAEGAEELFAQFKFLDPNIIGHDTWTAFKAEFCKIGFFKQIEGYRNLDKLRGLIDGHCYRVLADDCQDLPPRVYKVWPFDLSKNEQRIFDELKGEGLAFFSEMDLGPTEMSIYEKDSGGIKLDDDGVLEEHLALVKNMRLQQISSGWWPNPEKVKAIEKDCPSRLAALQRLLPDLPGKALIFARFRADLEILQASLGKEAVSYHGGVTDDDRAKNKRRFMEDTKVRWLLGQPRSAGIGHTLTAARHVVFYSNDPSLRLREECEKRAHRQGQKADRVLIWDLVARGTQDNKLITALRSKKKISNLILQDPDGFFLDHEH